MAKIAKNANIANKNTRKVNARNANANTGEIVLSAIKKLTKNTGWTARTIVKFVKMEYALTDASISRKISRALKRGVRLGLLQMERGRYRLNHMSRLVKLMEKGEVRSDQKRQRPKEQPLQFRSLSPKYRTDQRRN